MPPWTGSSGTLALTNRSSSPSPLAHLSVFHAFAFLGFLAVIHPSLWPLAAPRGAPALGNSVSAPPSNGSPCLALLQLQQRLFTSQRGFSAVLNFTILELICHKLHPTRGSRIKILSHVAKDHWWETTGNHGLGPAPRPTFPGQTGI